ncbi:hypothetical protein K438DRAFT_1989531 [Mycena galopus ATCC 62051]|nr:hypothetical protein K438DRAFT_1989531 [Mycena galopus ATCC 62051]
MAQHIPTIVHLPDLSSLIILFPNCSLPINGLVCCFHTTRHIPNIVSAACSLHIIGFVYERPARAQDEQTGDLAIAPALAVRHHVRRCDALAAVRLREVPRLATVYRHTLAAAFSPSWGCVKKRPSSPSVATLSLLLLRVWALLLPPGCSSGCMQKRARSPPFVAAAAAGVGAATAARGALAVVGVRGEAPALTTIRRHTVAAATAGVGAAAASCGALTVIGLRAEAPALATDRRHAAARSALAIVVRRKEAPQLVVHGVAQDFPHPT